MMSRSAMYARALVNVWEEAMPAHHAKVIERFVDILKSDHVEALALEIIKAVTIELQERASRRVSTVEVAHTVAVGSHTFKHFGEPTVKENKNLIGGFKMRTEGAILDASVAGALDQMRQVLSQS